MSEGARRVGARERVGATVARLPWALRVGLTLAWVVALTSLSSYALAEVPEHNPGYDDQCPKGFQYSRGPAACKQADCPPGAGRTYTYDCSCGEAWGKPFTTCRKDQLATHCVPQGQPCDDTGTKIGAAVVGILGGSILISSAQAALAGSGPVGWGLLVGGAAVGYAIYLWNRGRPGRFVLGSRLTAQALAPFLTPARNAVQALNDKMTGGLSPEQLDDLKVIYERWLNLDPAQREELRQEMLKEGVDMIKLGDALRWYGSLPPGQK